jgi:hypothetical protein
MEKDRRENKKLTKDDVKETLNRKQLAALHVCQHFGWRLKYIRSPLHQEPVPVLYNSSIDQIGILDPDGQINMDMELDVRTDNAKSAREKQPSQEQEAPEAVSWKEKRNDLVPVPDNVDDLLNEDQRHSLRQIEVFGWQLHFVRRPLFQEPVPVILSPEGDKYAILEPDGRINMTPDSVIRKEESAEPLVLTPSLPESKVN